MNLKKYLFIFLTIPCLLAAQKKREFIIGVQNIPNYFPESSYENGVYSGFAREVLDLFAEKNGIKFIYKALPIKRKVLEMSNQKVDLLYPDNAYWDADSKVADNFFYSKSLLSYTDGVLVKEDNKDLGIESIKKLGSILGYTPKGFKDELFMDEISLIENDDFKNLFKLVKSERLDGVYCNIAYAKVIMKDSLKGESPLVFNKKLPFLTSTRHLSTIRYVEVVEKFSEFLIEYKNQIDLLKTKYQIEQF